MLHFSIADFGLARCRITGARAVHFHLARTIRSLAKFSRFCVSIARGFARARKSSRGVIRYTPSRFMRVFNSYYSAANFNFKRALMKFTRL